MVLVGLDTAKKGPIVVMLLKKRSKDLITIFALMMRQILVHGGAKWAGWLIFDGSK